MKVTEFEYNKKYALPHWELGRYIKTPELSPLNCVSHTGEPYAFNFYELKIDDWDEYIPTRLEIRDEKIRLLCADIIRKFSQEVGDPARKILGLLAQEV